MITRIRKVALIGANGMLASMVRQVAPPGHEILLFDLPRFDITDRSRVLRSMGDARPEIIINCAAYTDVDACENREDLATRVNGAGPGYLAEAAKDCGAILVHISTDYVFDGRKGAPYTEEDAPNPLSAYGRSKLQGEEEILRSGLARFFIVRTSWLYGPGGRNFVETIVRLAGEREELRIVSDQIGSPTYTADLANAIFNLLNIATFTPATCVPRTDLYGIYHFSNCGQCSWHEFAEAIVKEMRKRELPVRTQRILPIPTEAYPLPAVRPGYSTFSKEKYLGATGACIPDWRSSLGSYFQIR